MKAFRQTAGANLDYTIDVSAWLVAGDVISSASWVVTTGTVTISNQQSTLTTASCFITGGTVTPPDDLTNNGNIVTCTISTLGGRVYPVSFTVIIDPYEP